jgi:hypothetical protein
MSDFKEYLPSCWTDEENATVVPLAPRLDSAERRKRASPVFPLAFAALSVMASDAISVEPHVVECTTGINIERETSVPAGVVKEIVADVPVGYWERAARSYRGRNRPLPESSVPDPDPF